MNAPNNPSPPDDTTDSKPPFLPRMAQIPPSQPALPLPSPRPPSAGVLGGAPAGVLGGAAQAAVPGLLRQPTTLHVPLRPDADVSPSDAPRLTFAPLTRRQSLLLAELEAERAEVSSAMLLADEARRAEGEALGLDFTSNEALGRTATALMASNNPGYQRWVTDAQRRYAPLFRRFDLLTLAADLVWVDGLLGDWRAVVGQDVAWASQTPPPWPRLTLGRKEIEQRVELAMDWPDEVVAALSAHLKAARKLGAGGLTEAERGN